MPRPPTTNPCCLLPAACCHGVAPNGWRAKVDTTPASQSQTASLPRAAAPLQLHFETKQPRRQQHLEGKQRLPHYPGSAQALPSLYPASTLRHTGDALAAEPKGKVLVARRETFRQLIALYSQHRYSHPKFAICIRIRIRIRNSHKHRRGVFRF